MGLGGAGFPTAVKLSPQNRLDTLIVNAAECEPYLNCDFRLMLEKTDGIVKGIRYVAQALGIRADSDRHRGEQAGGDRAV